MNRSSRAILLLAALSACAGSDGSDGASCTVVGDEIRCEDGTSIRVPAGDPGAPGEDGTSCTVTDNGDGSRTISCEDGTSVVVRDGEDGQDGEDGISCTVEDNGDGTRSVRCEDGTEAVIANGRDGRDGTSCTLVNNGDGTAALTCTDGTRATIPVATCATLGFVGAGFDIGGPWRKTLGSQILENDPGDRDPGVGIVPAAAVCGGGGFSQSTCIPGGDPLRVVARQRSDCGVGCSVQTTMRIGGGPILPLALADGTWRDAARCLGAGEVGSSVEFALSTLAPESCGGGFAGSVLFDQMRIETASPFTCPAPGQVLNGDFDFGDLGWTTNWTGGALVEAAGDSMEAVLPQLNGCTPARIEGQVSIPLADAFPNAALQVVASGSGTVRLEAFGTTPLTNAFALGSGWTSGRLCLPPSLAGTVIRVGVAQEGSCPSPVRIASVRLVSDPACGS